MREKRDVTLDFLKVVATSLIVCHHFQQDLGVRFSYFNFFGGRFGFGYLVELFFIISGICASRWIPEISEGSKSFKEFILKRAARLLPLTAASVVIYTCILMVYALIEHKWLLGTELDIFGMVAACLGIQCGWATANPMLNNPIWYISVLQLCYVVMYFVTWLAKRLSVSPYLFYIGMIFCGMGIQTYGINLPFLNYDASRGYMTFFLGLVLVRLFDNINIQSVWLQALAWLFSIGTMFVILAGYGKNMNFMLAFLFWPAIIVICHSKWAAKVIKGTFWSTCAKISFDVYIWHDVILACCTILPLKYSQVFYSLKGMILILVLAWGIGVLSHYFIEKPLNKFVMKKLDVYF